MVWAAAVSHWACLVKFLGAQNCLFFKKNKMVFVEL